MKWLVCLLALYILILGCIPCRADDDCCIEEAIVNGHASSDKTGDTGKTEHTPAYPRPCSPFFACGASHMFVVPEISTGLPNAEPVMPLQQAIYKASPLLDFPSLIWQPPRVA